MYTGSLINDLMATVELVRQKTQQQQTQEQEELRMIFAMQIPVAVDGQVFMGAA